MERKIKLIWHSQCDLEDVVEEKVENMQLQRSCRSLEKEY